jgi:hypothetical protein
VNQHDMHIMAIHHLLAKMSDDPRPADKSTALARAIADAAQSSSAPAGRDFMNCPF